MLLDVGLQVPPFVVGHREHDLEHPTWTAEGEQFGGFHLGETAELDVAEPAHFRITGLPSTVCSSGEWDKE